MEHRLSDSSSLSRSGYLPEATRALLFIHDTRASGRLSLRSSEKAALVHLYFNKARLVHVAGNTSSAEVLLNDLITWTRGSVRYDAGLLVTYETLTWQQAQAFARWLAFIEMRGILQGIPRGRLQGLSRNMTAQLPGEPITLPEEITHYEEYVEAARARQWQRINEGVQQFVERAISDEQREQLKQATQRVNQMLHQAGEVTQDVAKRVSHATQEGLTQAVMAAQEGLTQTVMAAQEATRLGARRAEELVSRSFNSDDRQEGQQLIQSVQETVDSFKQTLGQKVENAFAQAAHAVQTTQATAQTGSPLPPELQARSLRYRRALNASKPATVSLNETV